MDLASLFPDRVRLRGPLGQLERREPPTIVIIGTEDEDTKVADNKAEEETQDELERKQVPDHSATELEEGQVSEKRDDDEMILVPNSNLAILLEKRQREMEEQQESAVEEDTKKYQEPDAVDKDLTSLKNDGEDVKEAGEGLERRVEAGMNALVRVKSDPLFSLIFARCLVGE